MKRTKLFSAVVFVLIVTAALFTVVSAQSAEPLAPTLEIDWTVRHDIDFYQTTLEELQKNYPDIVKVYSIGHSWRERQLWTAEITSPEGADKTGIYVIANIHGGEQESAEIAMYFAWWLVTNSAEAEVKDILDKYIIYVTPVMNPDGYVASMVYNTRQNMRPTDANGDGIVFSDPYTDTNGDGFISEIWTGAADSKQEDRKRIGMESPDWDKNGIPGDDPKNSKIDMNRTFDYMWNLRDVDTDPQQGGDAFGRTDGDPATEPEVRAVQDFLLSHPVYAMATLHTGIQCVLYPWCYSDERVPDYEFMQATSQKMIDAFAAASNGRTAYEKQSYFDYPTAAEMIDWAYGRLNIHAYTIEVYRGGKSDPNGDDEALKHAWEDDLPEEKWEYIGDWQGLTDVWFRTTSRAQMARTAPVDQDVMVSAWKDAILEMIKSEPNGDGPKVPEYMKWGTF